MTDAGTSGQQWRYRRDVDIVHVGDVPVALRRDGHGTPVLYLHGAYFLRQWLPVHAAMAETFDVIAPDHPGFAGTPQGRRFAGFEDYVLHYDALLRQLDLEHVHLVGQGLGARIAAHLAVTYPTRFPSVTLITPTGLRLEGDAFVDEFRLTPAARLSVLFNGREDAHRAVWDLEGVPADVVNAYSDSTAHALLTWTDRFDHALERRLHRICSPTLVIAAEEDRLAGRAAARYAELIPEAELTVATAPDTTATSHAVHIEQPRSIASLTTGHIAAHSTAKDYA